MKAAQLQTRSDRSESMALQITLVVTLASLIVFGALVTIIKMDGNLIAVESAAQPASLPKPKRSYELPSLSGPGNENEPARFITTRPIKSSSF